MQSYHSFTFRLSFPRPRGLGAAVAAAGALLLVPTTSCAWVFGNNASFSFLSSMSGNGRYVAFGSDANNVVPNDTNGSRDVFRLDTQTGQVVRVNLDSSGNQATGGFSSNPSINSDGTKVAFVSSATNLVPGDTNGAQDVFVRDLTAGTTVRASVNSAGSQVGNTSTFPSLSSDGTKVAFFSSSTSLVSGDTNGFADVFVRDLAAGTTVRASVDSSGSQATGGFSVNPAFSSDGMKVAFYSTSTNLVSGDTNGVSDVFVRDLAAGTTVRASVNSSGNQATGGNSLNPSVSSDGTKITFYSSATDLVTSDTNGQDDIFVRDIAAGTTVRASVNSSASQATGGSSGNPSISSDGTKVAFYSNATNLVSGDTNGAQDVFVRNLTAGTTVRASFDSSGNQATGSSFDPSISADGTRVCFFSDAANLVAGDTNGFLDVFVRDLSAGTTTVPVTVSGFQLD